MLRAGRCSHGYPTKPEEQGDGWLLDIPQGCPLCRGKASGIPYKPGKPGEKPPEPAQQPKPDYTQCSKTEGCVCFTGHVAPCLVPPKPEPPPKPEEPEQLVCHVCKGPIRQGSHYVVDGEKGPRHVIGAPSCGASSG